MQAPRLNEVLARVVAWHNRHPLARRIHASQVQGIGEVQLPFASAQPVAPAPAATAAPAHLPTIAELLATEAIAPEVARFDALVRRAARTPDPAEHADRTDTAGPAARHEGDGEAALEIPLLGDGAEDDDSPRRPPDATDGEAPADDGTPTLADAAAQVLARPAAAVTDTPADGSAESPEAAGEAHATPDVDLADRPAPAGLAPAWPASTAAAPAAPPPFAAAPAGPWWRRWADALRAAAQRVRPGPRRPPLQPLFSEDFLWPLSPARIGRWARRHGALQPLAPADWPRRGVPADPRLRAGLRQRGLVHEAPLHLLSAAIGVGDRRMRVLVAADGSVLGPRAYSPPRLALAAGAAALALVASGWWLRQAGSAPGPAMAAAPAVVAASAPAVAPSAVAAASLPASATGIDAHAADTAPAAASQAVAAAPPADAAPAAAGPASAHAGGQAHAAGSAPVTAGPAPAARTASAAAADATARAAGGGARAAPPAAAPPAEHAASAPPSDIRPTLSDEARQAARAEAARLRGEPPPPPPRPATVFAVVTQPLAQRDAAQRAQAAMQAIAGRLAAPVPEHAELMGQPGQWRAAWWPFGTQADAERARVLLGARGLKAEVVEF